MATKIQVVCEWCNKEYELIPSLFKRSKHHFCSKACSGKWHTRRIETECDFCGASLRLTESAYSKSQKHFCSISCYSQWQRKDESERMAAICDQCGKKYVVSRPSQFSGFKHHFCSRGCYIAWKRAKKKKVNCVCDYCEKEYEAWPSHVNRTSHNFCSHPCSAKWRSENERGEDHPLWNRIKQNCTWCNRILWLQPNRLDRSDNFFCSKECKAAWWSENMSGGNHYNWKGGKSFEPYPPELNEAFRQKIRMRDEYICAICRLFGDNVHHINYVKEDTTPSNCITLCHGCHITTNYRRSYWQAELKKLMVARQLA